MPDAEHRSLLPKGLRWLGPLLAPLYGLGVRIHRALSRPKFAPIATICVGNITTGGTGKTPAVIFLAKELAKRGRKPAVLMRGYKQQAADEAEEVKAALAGLDIPILLGADRYANALKARELGRDVALLDDGFQHWRLARDLDIVLLDASEPFGGNALIPHGRLRESPKGLARAKVVICTRSENLSAALRDKLLRNIRRFAPTADVFFAGHAPSCFRELGGTPNPISLELLRGARVGAVCGIGNPDSFRNSLIACGAIVAGLKALPDHHAYAAEDINAMVMLARAGKVIVVVTEKDAVKIDSMIPSDVKIYALKVDFKIDDDANLWPHIEAALAAGDARAKLNQAQ